MEFTTQIPLTLYIHLPWCVKKCPYCDFNSHNAPDVLPEKAYIDALINDLDSNLGKIWGRRLSAIFFGGGTPSLFSPSEIQRLLLAIHARLPFHRDLEITMEANPGTVEQSRFEGFLDAGINRLSIGIQSFSDTQLKNLGRIHGAQEAHDAIDAAKKAGFNNLNIDIMHALPKQTHNEGLQDLQTAIDAAPQHISWYQLTIEPNTYFYKHPPTTPTDDAVFELQQAGQALLAQHGYEQYEISAYATPDQQCQHNLNYWRFGDYLGVGAGAHSKLTNMQHQVITRHWNTKNPKDYLNQKTLTIVNEKTLLTDEAIFEFMLNAGRLSDGFSVDLFERHTGLAYSTIKEKITQATNKGLVTEENGRIKPTTLGKKFANELILLFLDS